VISNGLRKTKLERGKTGPKGAGRSGERRMACKNESEATSVEVKSKGKSTGFQKKEKNSRCVTDSRGRPTEMAGIRGRKKIEGDHLKTANVNVFGGDYAKPGGRGTGKQRGR